jgi:hypothetical protein
MNQMKETLKKTSNLMTIKIQSTTLKTITWVKEKIDWIVQLFKLQTNTTRFWIDWIKKNKL